jgi:bacillithiol biosynthesis cysteine-adding enzyme BshC
MRCSYVRQTDLPHTTRLAADVSYHPDRCSTFYRHPLRSLDSFRAAAAEIRMSAGQRAALITALRVQNPESPALERLASPDTVAVATGQQVGLFSGPCYTVYKALHAARLAEWLTASGLPAVPVFWLATEDHDFAEVNHVWVFNADHRPSRVESVRSAGAQPVGRVALAAPPISELRAAMEGLPFLDEVVALVEEAYPPGATLGAAFGSLLRKLLKRFDILQLDPMLPQFRHLAAPAIRQAVEAAPELSVRVRERGRELAAAGYHAQVHVEEQTSLVFLLENGQRLTLRRTGSDYIQNGRRFTGRELMDRAADLSPNALLRPVVQDSMLPTVAYIGGAAEIAYLAQSAVLYDAVLGRMPVAVPRAGFTIVDQRSQKAMERFGLDLADFFHGEEALRQRIAATLVPPAMAGAMRDAQAAVETALEGMRTAMAGFDPTLVRALDRGASKIRYQLGKIQRKAGREALVRDARAARQAASLCGLIYPERHLQERLYSILPFLARHGLDLIGQIYESLDLECADHRILVVGE